MREIAIGLETMATRQEEVGWTDIFTINITNTYINRKSDKHKTYNMISGLL